MSTIPTAALDRDVPLVHVPRPQTHPDHLAVIATLFGMRPAPVDRARVLELGCGSGGNLLPMAEQYPEATFLGVDDHEPQVRAARQTIAQVGLANVELRQLGFAQVDDSLGEFDYIICGERFSRSAPEIQQKIFEICGARLARQGVALIRHDVYPAWHLRNVVRDLLRVYAGNEPRAAAAIAQSIKALRFIADSLSGDKLPYPRLLKQEVEHAMAQPPGQFWCDYLGDDHHPLYFHEFTERASAHGLQYLGEAALSTMFAENLAPAVQHNLLAVSPDVIALEQNMDVLRNRGSRETLLCRAEVSLARQITPERLENLYFGGNFRPQNENPDLSRGATEKFDVPGIGVISITKGAAKAAFLHLASQWPRAVSMTELKSAAAERLARHNQDTSDVDAREIAEDLIPCLANGLLRAFSQRDRFVCAVSERPQAGRLARWQARHVGEVTTRRHESLPVDQVSRQLLQRLDGQHDREKLLEHLIAAASRGELSIMINHLPVSHGEQFEELLGHSLDLSLNHLASNAVLLS